MLQVGIVGLPNVGKSTLFNALTLRQAQGKPAQAENRPFTTINPNMGVVPVPDERLQKLAELSKSAKITPTAIEFVDIAGLVKNAHAGEGLGNQFLSHIREVSAIAHVVRFFEDGKVTHVHNSVDPINDAETIETELALADLQSVERSLQRAEHDAKGNDKAAIARAAVLKNLQQHLADGKQARTLTLTEKEQEAIADVPLLTQKPVLYVANVSEEQLKKSEAVLADFTARFSPVLPLSVKIEQEVVELPEEEQATYLGEFGLTETGLNRLIRAGYELLNLITFFTSGPTETRAWTVPAGSLAPQAAGQVHSDMERGFIRAETVAYADLLAAGSYAKAREAGKIRDEGKEYTVCDGDVMLFKFSV